MVQYKIRFKPDLDHRRRRRSADCYNYQCKDRIFSNRSNLGATMKRQTEHLNMFHHSSESLKKYYIIQEIIHYTRNITLLSYVFKLLKKTIKTVYASKLFTAFKPITNTLDLMLSKIISAPLSILPSCRSISIREAQNLALYPMKSFIKLFFNVGKLISTQKPKKNIVIIENAEPNAKTNDRNHSASQSIFILNVCIYFLLSIIDYIVTFILFCCISENHEKTRIAFEQSTIRFFGSKLYLGIMHENLIHFQNDDKALYVRWSYDFSLQTKNLINIYPENSMKPRRTLVTL